MALNLCQPLLSRRPGRYRVCLTPIRRTVTDDIQVVTSQRCETDPDLVVVNAFHGLLCRHFPELDGFHSALPLSSLHSVA